MPFDPLTGRQKRLLRERRHRDVVALLRDADGPLHVRDLATRLVEDDVSIVDESAFEERVDERVVSLHHRDLPTLAEADLLEYHPGRNVVEAIDGGSISAERTDGDGLEEVLTTLGSDGSSVTGTDDDDVGDDTDVGILEGREAAIRYGRRLADESEEELFCLFVSNDLLEGECTCRARDAIERGVDVSFGSGNPEVRREAQEALPEATVWEPQYDWLHTPTYPRIGRLVMADRRHVMLAILEEPPGDGTSEETAVVGRGAENPVVVLVRELLGSRLDHLDFQSETFIEELHT